MTIPARDPAREQAITFSCGGAALLGIVHPAPAAADTVSPAPASAGTGVLIVVGGPQYRTGSHRQFLLLARQLAADGIPVMRFDHRGIGDSEGDFRGFEALDEDIAAAIDAFQAHCPGLKRIVLWGLCDAAAAILFYAHRDPRVSGVVLLNPWVRTPAGEARAVLRHYYLQRLVDGAFWRRLAAGRVNPWASAKSLLELLARRFRSPDAADTAADSAPLPAPLPDRMAAGLARYRGPVLLIMSGRDLTAREFEDAAAASDTWRRLLGEPRVRRCDLGDADHTFSRRAWRDTVAQWTVAWLRRQSGDGEAAPSE